MSDAHATSNTAPTILEHEGEQYVNFDRFLNNKNSTLMVLRKINPGEKTLLKLSETISEYTEEVRMQAVENAKRQQEINEKVNELMAQVKSIAEASGNDVNDLLSLMAAKTGLELPLVNVGSQSSSRVAQPLSAGKTSASGSIPAPTSKRLQPRYKLVDEEGTVEYWRGAGPRPPGIDAYLKQDGHSKEDLLMTEADLEEWKELQANEVKSRPKARNAVRSPNDGRLKPAGLRGYNNLDTSNNLIRQLGKYKEELGKGNLLLPRFKLDAEDGSTYWHNGRGRYKPEPFDQYVMKRVAETKDTKEPKGPKDVMMELMIPDSEQAIEQVKKLRSEGNAQGANDFLAIEVTLMSLNKEVKTKPPRNDVEWARELKKHYDEKLGISDSLKVLIDKITNGEHEDVKPAVDNPAIEGELEAMAGGIAEDFDEAPTNLDDAAELASQTPEGPEAKATHGDADASKEDDFHELNKYF